MQRAMDRLSSRSGAHRAPSAVFRTPGAAPTFLLKLLWLSESDNALWFDCLVRYAEHLLH